MIGRMQGLRHVARRLRRTPPRPGRSESGMAALVRAADQLCAGEGGRLRLFGEGGLVMGDVERLLPKAADASFDGYAQRVTAELGSPSFTLATNCLQSCDYELWDAARRFLDGL